MSLKQILLVDDSSSDREMVMSVLQQYRLTNEIVELRDGVEALDYLLRRGEFSGRKGDDPMVILLDLKMPRMGGLEVLREIKQDRKLKVIPVVVMTSSREETDLIKSYKLGVNAYVVKPLNFHEFVEAVKSVRVFWTVVNELPPVKFSERT